MNHSDKKTTHSLERILIDIDSEASLTDYLVSLDGQERPESFRAYFFHLDKVTRLTDAELQKKSGIERTYYYHIRSGAKKPGRDKILRLCLAASLDETETRRALEAAGQPVLYARDRRDAVLSYAIRKKLGVIDANLLLAEYSLPPLAG